MVVEEMLAMEDLEGHVRDHISKAEPYCTMCVLSEFNE
jgi:hypothetical protein